MITWLLRSLPIQKVYFHYFSFTHSIYLYWVPNLCHTDTLISTETHMSLCLSQQLFYLYISMTQIFTIHYTIFIHCVTLLKFLWKQHTHIYQHIYTFFSELDCKLDVNEIPFYHTSFIVASPVFCTWKFNTTFLKFVKCTEWPIHRFFKKNFKPYSPSWVMGWFFMLWIICFLIHLSFWQRR